MKKRDKLILGVDSDKCLVAGLTRFNTRGGDSVTVMFIYNRQNISDTTNKPCLAYRTHMAVHADQILHITKFRISLFD